MIGQLPNEEMARALSDCLYAEGITNQVELEKDHWTIWIHAEDEVEQAKGLLDRFRSDPADPVFQKLARRARDRRTAEAKQAAAARTPIDRDEILRRSRPYTVGICTMLLLLACVLVAVLSELGSNRKLLGSLFISEFAHGAYLPEVRRGEVWRLITPILIHFGWLHLVFNMMCLVDLGSMVEGRQNRLTLLALVLVIGVGSNLGQYFQGGPLFGGMSGVIYGLLGYIWMKGRFDPGSGLFLHPQTVIMMLVWFFVCLFDIFPGVANTAHGVGLALGVVWGYASALLRTAR